MAQRLFFFLPERGRVDGALGECILDVGQNSKGAIRGGFRDTERTPQIRSLVATSASHA